MHHDLLCQKKNLAAAEANKYKSIKQAHSMCQCNSVLIAVWTAVIADISMCCMMAPQLVSAADTTTHPICRNTGTGPLLETRDRGQSTSTQEAEQRCQERCSAVQQEKALESGHTCRHQHAMDRVPFECVGNPVMAVSRNDVPLQLRWLVFNWALSQQSV